MTVKVKIINLKKDVEKKKNIENQLKNLKIDQDFYDAIYGKELDHTIINDLNKKSSRRQLSKGEIGCLLSHITILKSVKKDDIFFILEDDVVLSERLPIFLKKISIANFDWDVILLGHGSEYDVLKPTPISLWGRKKIDDFIVGKPIVKAMGAWGYLVNHTGAQKILEKFSRVTKPYDHYTGDTAIQNLYVIQKPLLHQSPALFLQSNLEQERIEMNEKYYLSQTGIKSLLKKIHFFRWLNKIRWTLVAEIHYLKVLLPVKGK